MKCNYCPATSGLRRVKARTPTGHDVAVLVCPGCRESRADEIAQAKLTRTVRRKIVELAMAKATPIMRSKLKGRRRRKTVKDRAVDRTRRLVEQAARSLQEDE
jgi:hypothetical protein